MERARVEGKGQAGMGAGILRAELDQDAKLAFGLLDVAAPQRARLLVPAMAASAISTSQPRRPRMANVGEE